jgi:hypothetical protein
MGYVFGAAIGALTGTAASLLFGTVHWSQPLLWALALVAVWTIIDGFFLKGFFLSRARRLRLNRRQDNTPLTDATPNGEEPISQPPAKKSYGFSNYGSSNITYTDTSTPDGYLNVDSHDIHYNRARHTNNGPIGQ